MSRKVDLRKKEIETTLAYQQGTFARKLNQPFMSRMYASAQGPPPTHMNKAWAKGWKDEDKYLKSFKS